MKRSEIRLRSFENNPDFDFLPHQDRWLLQKSPASVKVAIIGLGTIGLEHLRVAALEERAEVVAIYDSNPEIASYALDYCLTRLSIQPTLVKSLELLVQDASIDGFFICTPNFTHLDIFKIVMASNKPIYLEKPMAHTLEQAIALYRLAKTYGAPVHIGLQYRFKPQYVQALKAIAGGTLGKAHQIQMVEHRPPFLDKVQQWNKYAQFSGGTLIEKCCHYFNLMHLIAKARPVRVSCFAQQATNFLNFNTPAQSDIVDSAQVTIEFDNKIIGSLSLCMFSPSFYEELIICGDKARIKTTEEFNPILSEPTQCSLEILQHEDEVSSKSIPAYGAAIAQTGHYGSTYKAHEHFIDAILNIAPGTQTRTVPGLDPASIEESLWSIIIGHAAQVAAQQNLIVDIEQLLIQHDICELFQ